jgi:DNA repair exonuclease SbcCD ATPase subunit
MTEVLEKRILDLLGRREELVNRLNSLEEMKPNTNERVYWKIREDYSGQLQSVLEKINEQRGSLEEKARTLAEQISEKEQIHTEQSDQVDELQIRAHLGEFNHENDVFKTELTTAESARDKTASMLEKLRRELDDLNGVLGDVDEATSAGIPGGDYKTPAPHKAEPAPAPVTVEEELIEEIGEEELLEESDEELEELDKNTCPACGHENPPHLVVCEECNAELEDLGADLDDEFDFDDVDVDL